MRRDAERAALLLDYREGLSFASVGFAVHSVAAGDLLGEGSGESGSSQVFEFAVARAVADENVSGLGGGPAKSAARMIFAFGWFLDARGHACENFPLRRKNGKNQVIGQRDRAGVANLDDQQAPILSSLR